MLEASQPQYMGTASCASSPCHGSVVPLKGTSVLRNEVTHWSKHDRHAKAYETLLSSRSQMMAKHLGISKAHEAPECLSCHATPAAADQRSSGFRFSEGVSCEACHGAAEFYLKPHAHPTQRDRAKGLIELSSPAVLASTCLDCHLGRADSWLTHRLYGAGHPRLSFELDTYLANLPPHHKEDADYIARKGKSQPAKRWLMGELEKAKRQIIQFVSAPKRNWPDLSSHYCFQCHSSLKADKWSFKEAAIDPGVPKLNLSSAHLAVVALKVINPDLSQKMRGSLENGTVHETQKLIDQAQTQTRRIEITRNQTERILKELLAFAVEDRESQNYEVAEQITMASSSLLEELSPSTPLHEKELKSLYASLDRPESFRPTKFKKACSHLAQKMN